MEIRSKIWSRLFVAFAVLLFGASAVQAATVTVPITVENSAEQYSADAVGNIHTLSSFAVSGEFGRKLVVCTGTENGGTVVGITYGGTPLALAAANVTHRLAEIWYLDDPAVGAADIVVTMSADGDLSDMRVAALSLSGARSGVSASANDGSSSIETLSIELTTTELETLVVGSFLNNGQAITATSFTTNFTYGTAGSSNMSAGYVNVASPATADYDWTNANADRSGAALAGFAGMEVDPIQYVLDGIVAR